MRNPDTTTTTKGKRKKHPSNNNITTTSAMVTDEERPRLVLVGAGYANLQVLKLLADSKAFESITLVDVQTYATYCGVIPCSLARGPDYSNNQYHYHHQKRETAIDLQNLCHLLNIYFVNDGVVDVDPDRRLIHLTETQQPISYDILSLDIGSATKALDAIPGAFDYAIPLRPMHELEERLEQAENEFIDIMSGGGGEEMTRTPSYSSSSPPLLDDAVRLAVVGGGALGIELALCLESRWRPLLGDHLHIVLVTADSTLLPERASARKILKKILMEKGITLSFHANIVEVEEHRLCLETGMQIPFRYCVWATGGESHDLAKTLQQRGLDVTDEGWIQVQESLQSTSHPNIFAAGDCCASDSLTLPKAAGGIHTLQEGPILAHNLEHYALRESLEPLELSPSYSAGSMQFISCGDGTAIGFAFGIPMRGRWVWEIKNAMNHEFFSLIEQGGQEDGHHSSTTTTNIAEDDSFQAPTPMAAAAMLHRIDIGNYRLAWDIIQYMTQDERYRIQVLSCYQAQQQEQEEQTSFNAAPLADPTGRAAASHHLQGGTSKEEQDFSMLRAPQPAL